MKAAPCFSPEARAKCAAASRAGWADPEKRAARIAAISAAQKARHAAYRVLAARKDAPVEVPAWAHAAGLAETYAALAAKRGEFQAASLCRRIKAGRANA